MSIQFPFLGQYPAIQTTNLFNSFSSFCLLRFNPQVVQRIVQENNGLIDLNSIEKALKASDYVSVMKGVWSEKDGNKKLEWLREKAKFLHAPLIYELGIVEFIENPTIETINCISLPLLKAGGFRTAQDAFCFDERSIKIISDILDQIYRETLEKLVKKSLDKSLQEIFSTNKERRIAAIVKKIQEIALQSLQTTFLPNPRWIIHYYIQSYRECIEKHSEELWDNKRKAFASIFLEELENIQAKTSFLLKSN